MTHRFELRDLTDDDLASLSDFSCTANGGAAGVALIERQIRTGKIIRTQEHVPGGRCVEAVIDGHVAACAFIEPIAELTLPPDVAGARFVRLFAVHDDYQGVDVPGIGRVSDRLIVTLHATTVSEVGSPAAVLLRVDPRNNRALAFYACHHYVPVPTPSGTPFYVRQVTD